MVQEGRLAPAFLVLMETGVCCSCRQFRKTGAMTAQGFQGTRHQLLIY